ncbi:hypothetical protein QBC38DRAFT_184706 [Podospora fimiseda]|uniref:Uncharacterized protein n=1 Tax=Podospora fimiseda TaxID=252190 RepID=A0AAN7BQL9_9PEZI|nr:hypothetical protein QBC38DRAFT_184706 [Podospora fimiseda]
MALRFEAQPEVRHSKGSPQKISSIKKSFDCWYQYPPTLIPGPDPAKILVYHHGQGHSARHRKKRTVRVAYARNHLVVWSAGYRLSGVGGEAKKGHVFSVVNFVLMTVSILRKKDFGCRSACAVLVCQVLEYIYTCKGLLHLQEASPSGINATCCSRAVQKCAECMACRSGGQKQQMKTETVRLGSPPHHVPISDMVSINE